MATTRRTRRYTAVYRRTGGTQPAPRVLRAATDSEALSRAQAYLGGAGRAAGWHLAGLRSRRGAVEVPEGVTTC